MLKKLGLLLVITMMTMTISACNSDKKGESNNSNQVQAATYDDSNNMLKNPLFEEELSSNTPDEQGVVDTENNWIFFTNNGAEASYSLEEEMIKVTPTNVDAPSYGIQLIQSPVLIENLSTYKVSITAKAEEARNITIKIGATGHNQWKAYSEESISLTTELSTYDYEFTMNGQSDAEARFEIFLAEDISPVWFDHVSMERIGEEEALVTEEELLSREKTEADEDLVEDWQLVWADEFDGPTINEDNWTIETGNGADRGIPGWGNNEMEYYTDSQDNVFIEDGNLIFQALEEEKTFTVDGTEYTTDYTSGKMVTSDKISMKYGKIEARVKLPSGQGIWPAFWLLGEDIGTVGWPTCGEIDILEYIGSDVETIHGTVHGPVSSGPGINGHVELDTDLSEDYHIFSIEWDEDEVEFYIDDILYHIVNKDEVILEYGPDEWVYDHPYYIILNLAVGGNWPGAPDETTTFPKQLAFDYIRIYEDKNPDSIDGQEVIDTEYEKPATAPGVAGLSDGTFDEDGSGWGFYAHNDAEGSVSYETSEAVITLENDGGEDYSIHLYQGPFNIEESKSYKLEFDAKADIPRDMLVVLDNASYNRYVNDTVSLNNEMKTYSITFTGIDDDCSLKFLIGELGDNISDVNKVYIDNVSIQEVE